MAGSGKTVNTTPKLPVPAPVLLFSTELMNIPKPSDTVLRVVEGRTPDEWNDEAPSEDQIQQFVSPNRSGSTRLTSCRICAIFLELLLIT